MENLPSPSSRAGDPVPLELRHLAVFQQVYITKDYTMAAHDLNLDRKGILRVMERLEHVFRNPLFTEPRRGVLEPSPFADRLFNDLRSLNAARESLHQQVEEIRAHGRPVRIGASPMVFRSSIFRNLFRDLQISGKIRACYIPIPVDEATKALTGGTCDLHIGCVSVSVSRFISHLLGHLPFQMLKRMGADPSGPSFKPWIVSSDEMRAEPITDEIDGYTPLDETQFLHWLDHPEECPPGTLIFAPEIPVSSSHWEIIATAPPAATAVQLRYLRQHPYEFLPALVNSIKTLSQLHDHA
jgi:DNA-binding transcriptional LysR family regulator